MTKKLKLTDISKGEDAQLIDIDITCDNNIDINIDIYKLYAYINNNFSIRSQAKISARIL